MPAAHLCDSDDWPLPGRAVDGAGPRLPDLALLWGTSVAPDLALANAESPKSDARSDAAVVVTKLDTLLRMLASASKNSSGPAVSCSACTHYTQHCQIPVAL